MITNIEAINKRLEGVTIAGEAVDFAKLVELHQAEEEKAPEVSEITLLTDEKLDQTLRRKYEDGKEAGTRDAVRSVKDELGLDIKHSPDALIDAVKGLKEKAEAKGDTEWEQKYKQVKSTYEQEKEQWEGKFKTFEQKETDRRINGTLERDAFKDVKALDASEAVSLFRMQNEVYTGEDGNLYIKRNGETVANKLGEPIPASEIAKEYAAKRGWSAAQAGRGDGNSRTTTGKKYKTMADAYNAMEADGVIPNTEEAKAYIDEVEETE